MSIATFESEVFDVLPGDEVVSLIPAPQELSSRERRRRMNEDHRHRIDRMSEAEKHYYAADLTLELGGELLIRYRPDDVGHLENGEVDEGSRGFCFDIHETDPNPSIIISYCRYVDARDHNFNLAAAVVEELEWIANAHAELAARAKRALGGHLPWPLDDEDD